MPPICPVWKWSGTSGVLPPLDPKALSEEITRERLERIVLAGDSPGFFKPVFTRAMALAGKDPDEVRWRRSASTARRAGSGTPRAESTDRLCGPGGAVRPGCSARHHGYSPGDADHRSRGRRHPGGPRDRRRREAGLPGRAHGDDRRAHGDVRQDVPHSRLRRLHPHAEDGGGRSARDDRPDDVLRGGGRHRLSGRVQGAASARQARHVDLDACVACNACTESCPTQGPQRVRLRHRHAEGDLHPLPAGGAERLRAR